MNLFVMFVFTYEMYIVFESNYDKRDKGNMKIIYS